MAILAELSGWFGALAVLAGYLALSLGWIRNGRLFQASNLVGSGTLIINGYFHGAMPSVVLNIAWATISAVALVRLYRAKKPAQVPEATDDVSVHGLPVPAAVMPGPFIP